MKIKELSFKIGDEVFRAEDIGNMWCDSVEFGIQLFWSTENSQSMRTITCDPEIVEVIVNGE